MTLAVRSPGLQIRGLLCCATGSEYQFINSRELAARWAVPQAWIRESCKYGDPITGKTKVIRGITNRLPLRCKDTRIDVQEECGQ